MFQRCLICTDFEDGLHRLVGFVPSLAAGGIKQIVFFHSVPLWQEGEIPRVDDKAIAKANDRFKQALGGVPDGVDVRIEVVSGRPVENIRKVAENYDADIILTGMPIRSLLQEKLFGSTTAELARSCKTPLLILRPQLISTYTREELDLRCQHLFRYLLIPYDGSNAANYVVQRVKKSAQSRPENSLEQCMLMRVIEEGGRRAILEEHRVREAQETITPVKAELEQLGLQVNTEVRVGNPYEEILDAALEFDISAIAMSSDTLGKPIEFPVRSFAGELMRRSWHPVLFFPPTKQS